MAILKEVQLISTGIYLPDKIPFDDIERIIGRLENAPQKIGKMIQKLHSMMKKIIQPKYSYFAIDKKTGKPNENNVEMSTKAIRLALDKAKMTPDEVDCIILGAPIPDYLIPATTPLIQEKLGIKECVEFEVHSNCTAISKALQIGYDSIRVGRYKNVVVVYSQNPSAYLNAAYYNQDLIEPENLLLRWFLSDGASAVVLKASDEIKSGLKITGVYNDSIGIDLKAGMWIKFGAANMNLLEAFRSGSHHFGQDYGLVNERAPWIGVKGFKKLMEQFGLNNKMIDHLIITLPSTKIEDAAKAAFEKELGISPNIWENNVAEKGYCGGASLISYVDEMIEKDLIKRGETAVAFAVESSKWMVGGFAFKNV